MSSRQARTVAWKILRESVVDKVSTEAGSKYLGPRRDTQSEGAVRERLVRFRVIDRECYFLAIGRVLPPTHCTDSPKCQSRVAHGISAPKVDHRLHRVDRGPDYKQVKNNYAMIWCEKEQGGSFGVLTIDGVD